MTARVGDCFHEIAPLRSPVLGDYTVEIERRFGCEKACQFEYVCPVAGRVCGFVRDVIFLPVNVEPFAEIFTRLEQGIDETNVESVAFVLRRLDVERDRVRGENEPSQI